MNRPRSLLRLGLVTACAGLLAAGAAAGGLDGLDIRIGKALFERAWVPAPSSTKADDGLGPLFDARSCASCHPADRRARTSVDAQGHLDGRGMVLVLAQKDGKGDPVYGRRLQIDAVPGLAPEGILGVTDTALPDGLTRRVPAPDALAYGPLSPATGLSLRTAPDLRGRGLLEQVPEPALLALEADQGKGPDAVHGRLRRVTLPDGATAIGRYGWKAAQPTLASQSAEAFFLDMGLSTPMHPEPWGDCTEAQAACRAAPHGRDGEDGFEIPDALLSRVVAYVTSLPVPETPKDGVGARLFAATGCAACHRPALPTAGGGQARLFTDLMLHDLGPGLADTMPEPGAAAGEWRTAPLAGLSDALARDTGLLHDGRARSVEEAVLRHAGQAETAVRRFRALPAGRKAALLAYVSKL
ncbi:di-heme oxidoredictase family protein [Azorhizobium doebereinerae]|uniref:di-heme oxidoredictase family protein n=1 Tax=Azorhizobium doebereinerae TaxID=281091 RepID=UPI000401F780|nr:di-heme oxidoredictase family protein [Azorhizobium doebereinerae]